MKKNVSLLLALLMVLSCVVSMVACNKKDKTPVSSGSGEGQLSDTDEWGRPVIESPLDPTLYYEGKTVTVLSRNDWESVGQFVPSELDSDVINSAVLKRNEMVLSRLGVTIENMPVNGGNFNSELNQLIRTQVHSGACEFDMIANFAYYGSALAMEGYYYDLKKLSHLHTDQIWWNQDYIRQSVIGDRMYMAVNDSCLRALRYTMVTFFNKGLVQDWLKGVNLYDAVNNNEWTLDYFNRLIKDVYEDKNGSGIAEADDLFGMITSTSSQNIDAWFSGLGLRTCTIGNDGIPVLSLENDLTISCFEQVRNLFFNNTGVFVNGTATTDYVDARKAFAENHSLFSTGQLDNGGVFVSEMQGDFGVLPMPKIDAEDPYTTTPQDAYDFLAIPSCIFDKSQAEMIGAVMEYMAYASYMTTKPSYFETITKLRYSNDVADANMFDLISEHVYFDFGMIYSSSIVGIGTNLGHFWRNLFQTGATNFSSEYSKSSSAYEKQLENVIEMLTT